MARNRVKRRIREAVRLSRVASGWDMVLIARGQAGQAEYQTLKQAVEDLLRRASFLMEQRRPGPAKADHNR